VSRRVVAPDPVTLEARFVETLTALGGEYPGSLLVPADDDALLAVARHHASLSKQFVVACMAWDLAKTCLDKRETHAMAVGAGIPAPRTFTPASRAQLEDWSRELRFPCLVKPRLSHLYSRSHGTKMEKVDSLAELLKAWDNAAQSGADVLVQEFIPGPDHNGANYNVYVADGEVWAESTAHKIRSKRPEIDSPRVVLSRDIPEVTELGRCIVEAVGIHGFANMEFKRHAGTGDFHLIEINARHNMSGELAVRCGVNFPFIEYEHRMNGVRLPSVAARTGVYWINLEWDLRQAARLALRGELPRTYFRPYVRPHVYDVLDWRDPGPFAERARDAPRKIRGAKAGDG